jgi:hypothetical protein
MMDLQSGRTLGAVRHANACEAWVVQVIVDADNLPASRLRVVATALSQLPMQSVRIVVAGRSSAIDSADWPDWAKILRISGWQEADLALAKEYVADREPLLLVTGDFGLLAARHPGPVLVVSAAASGRLREAARVLDPVLDGGAGLRDWLAAALGDH